MGIQQLCFFSFTHQQIMKTVFVVLACMAVAYARPLNNRAVNGDNCGTRKVVNGTNNRIVNGETAYHGQFPWQISLRYGIFSSKSHICGGSIIDEQWILTAAHCFGNSRNPDYYQVRVGSQDQTSGGSEEGAVVHDVEKVIRHEDFSQFLNIRNDIGLLKLKKPIDFGNKYVNRVCLNPQSNDLIVGHKLINSGWGRISGGGAIPAELQYTTLIGLDNKECAGDWGDFTYDKEQMVCAEEDNTSPCNGDSGGPLTGTYTNEDGTQQEYQAGVVSFGNSGCAGPNPPVFTSVSYFYDWIQENIADNS